MRLGLRYSSRIGRGIVDLSLGILASLDWSRPRLTNTVSGAGNVCSRFEALSRHHHREDSLRDRKGKEAMAFGCIVAVCKKGKAR